MTSIQASEPFAGNILMVVGGHSATDGGTTDKVYSLSLDPSRDVPPCLRHICDFPHVVDNPTTAIFQDGLPAVCGGWKNLNRFYKQCYKFNFTDAWIPAGLRNDFAVWKGWG